MTISTTKCNHARYEKLKRMAQRPDGSPAGTPTEMRKARVRRVKQVRESVGALMSAVGLQCMSRDFDWIVCTKMSRGKSKLTSK